MNLAVIVMILATLVVTLATQLRADVGLTGASLVSLMSFGTILANMVNTWTQLEVGIGAVNRLESFCKTVKSEHRNDDPKEPPENWPVSGAINIYNVSASYE